ncbi:hypothetical protein HDU98_002172 [Podochytrium sp. JEL0797]|nr:hypothetical protein HDU98_002172 [Podochytrium sp. JEL0797]
MSEWDVSEILTCHSLSTVEHWSFLVTWLKARQYMDELSAGSGVGELDISLAREDAVLLLPIFCGSLYYFPPEVFKLLVELYLSLFSEEMQTCLEFHFKSASKEIQKWGMDRQALAKSNILARTSIKSLEAGMRPSLELKNLGNSYGAGIKRW